MAGVGFRLLENQSAAGDSLGPVYTETVADCALACLRVGCDGFAFPADPPTPKLRTCYRYKAPLTFYAHGTFRAGKRIEDVAATPKLADAGGTATDAPSPLARDVPRISMAQADATRAAPVQSDDLTRCANGPVKVTGFRLTCDKILTGGTTLGSAQLRYTVPNINACAAKCQPLAGCTGFTFNAADPDGQHACEIFGGRPGMNDGRGWVSGTR